MITRIGLLLASVVLASTSAITNASLLNDDSIGFSVNLTSTSGNGITASDSFVPGSDSGPTGLEGFDGGAVNGDPDFDFGVLFDVSFFNSEISVITMVIADSLFTPGTPEFVWGTVTFSDLGWGSVEGDVVFAGTCFPGADGPECGQSNIPPSGLTDTSVTINIAENLFMLDQSQLAGDFAAVSVVTFVGAAHVPVPSTILLLGLGLAGLGWSGRKKA